MDIEAYRARLAREDAAVQAGGGEARQARQRRLGRLTARERIAALVDEGSFWELGRHVEHPHADLDPRLAREQPPGDGLICGFGTVDGARIAVCAHDPTVFRGAVGSTGAQKLRRLLEAAHDRSLPVVTLADSDGARIPEGVHAMLGWSEVMAWVVRHRTRAPHLTVVPGLCVGAAAYSAALADLVVMVRDQSFMFLTGPTVTRTVTGEDVDIEDLGGATLHAEVTGSCHALVDTEQQAIAWVRAALGYTCRPQQPSGDDPARPTPELLRHIPTGRRRAYDAHKVLEAVADQGSLLELSPRYAPNLLTALCRLDGRSVALLCSQTLSRAGCLDIDASRKGAAFLAYAQAHGLPVVTLVDTSGYLPGQQQERGGVLREGARLIRAYAELTVPTVSVTLRKSYGGASVLSCASRIRLALPMAEVAPMGAEAAASVAIGPPKPDGSDRDEHAAFCDAWRAHHGDAWRAAARGFFDAVIDPAALRAELIRALA